MGNRFLHLSVTILIRTEWKPQARLQMPGLVLTKKPCIGCCEDLRSCLFRACIVHGIDL